MELNLKGLGKKDMAAFKELPKNREKIIHSSSSSPIRTDYVANEIGALLHPTVQHVKVVDIIEENKNTKTFVLGPNIDAGTKKLAYFRPGQYISIEVPIESGLYRRPYTISCSPKNVFDNLYTITVQRKPRGIVSNYFLDSVEVDDTFTISGPMGNFYYEPLRDARNVIALVNGRGITSILSMAEAIKDGILDFKLTILYSARAERDLLFKQELEEISRKNNLIHIEYILSDEDKEEYYYGHLSKEIIEPFLEPETSFFVSGTNAFLESTNAVLKEFNLPNKYIRHDAFFGKVDLFGNDPYTVTVITSEKEYTLTCHHTETLLSAMEKEGIPTNSRCQVGECGFCRSKLKSGMVRTIDGVLRKADEENEFIHPCVAFPESDVVLELPF